jgi:hypothetical protein
VGAITAALVGSADITPKVIAAARPMAIFLNEFIFLLIVCYIKLNLSNWETGRVYKIEFKIDMDGDVKYYDDKITFTVVNN